MYHTSAQGVDERVINVHYDYYYYQSAREVLTVRVKAQQEPRFGPVFVCARTSVCG